MPSEFTDLLHELEDWRNDRDRLEKALAWAEESQQDDDLQRLRATDHEIAAGRFTDAPGPRENAYKALCHALNPEARQRRAAERARQGDRFSSITAKLEALAPDPGTDRTTIIEKALTPGYFASAWQILASANAAGQATPAQLAKATDHLHTLQYGALMENVGLGDIGTAREHLRILTSTGAFESPQQAARIEHTINNPPDRSMLKARTPTLTTNPQLAEIVRADAWSAIPTAPHQR